MQRAIVLAVLITPTHSSFIIKLHILIAPVELSHFTVWIFDGSGGGGGLIPLCFINICTVGDFW